jgi:hypothetical protein
MVAIVRLRLRWTTRRRPVSNDRVGYECDEHNAEIGPEPAIRGSPGEPGKDEVCGQPAESRKQKCPGNVPKLYSGYTTCCAPLCDECSEGERPDDEYVDGVHRIQRAGLTRKAFGGDDRVIVDQRSRRGDERQQSAERDAGRHGPPRNPRCASRKSPCKSKKRRWQ